MKWIIKICCIAFLAISCKKPDPVDSDTTGLTNGLLVLNEGLFQNNNAGLTFYSHESNTLYQSFYQSINAEPLGDVANDMQIYGGKIYIVVHNSNLVNVIDAHTGINLEKISFYNGSIGRLPRNIAFHQGKAYVCSFDGSVAKIDTASLSIEAYVSVGRNPDGLTVANNKLYVSNSGGLDFPNYDSTISVVDLNSFTEIKKVNVGINPGSIITDGQGDVYLIRRGDYGAIPSRMLKIDSNLDSLVDELSNVDVSAIRYSNDQIIYAYQTISGGVPIIGVYDALSESIMSANLIDLSQMSTLYGFDVDDQNQRIYIYEANNYSSTGDVLVYDFNGTLLSQFGTGYLPRKIIVKD